MKKTTLMTWFGILLTTAVLTGCGGGGGGGGGGDTANLPAAPTATIDYGIKTVILSWGSVVDATEYKVFENPDGHSDYSEIATGLTTTSYSHEIFLPARINASYIVAACNSHGCTDSAPVTVSSTLGEAIGYVKASNTEADDEFGWSVALSRDGNTLAVGAPGEDSAGIDGNQTPDCGAATPTNCAPNSGAVYVFSRSGSNWIQQAYVKASNAEADDRFGYSVALSGDGNALAVGAIYEDSAATGIGGDETDNSATARGAVYVFTRNGTTWSQEAYVKGTDPGTSNYFGVSVALSYDGFRLAVGAHGEEGDRGAVYVFTRPGSWFQEARLQAFNAEPLDRFGQSVAFRDGTVLAVGAPGEDSAATGQGGDHTDNNAPDSGAVYIFTRSSSNWSQRLYIKASNTEAGDKFGFSVALSFDGYRLVVGAPGEDSAATGIDGNQVSDCGAATPSNCAPGSGAVYVFDTFGGVNWSQGAYVKASNTSNDFGWRVALSSDGLRLAVGARGEDSAATGIDGNQAWDCIAATNCAPNSGAVYIFTLSRNTYTWSQQAYVKASNTDADDRFGQSVALSDDGNVLAIGAFFEDSAATGIGGDHADDSAANSGAVYLY